MFSQSHRRSHPSAADYGVACLAEGSALARGPVLGPRGPGGPRAGFGVTQHINGKHILAEFKDHFDGKGSLHLKPGSQDVWEYKAIRLD